jgi:hypothetical protein
VLNLHRLLIYGAVFTIMGLSNTVIPILPELANLSNSFSGGFASSLLFSAYYCRAFHRHFQF